MILLIIGGSGSGKSEYAEKRCVDLAKNAGSRLFYIATMEPYDKESQKRIARHRRMRQDKHFTTIECYTKLETLTFEPTDTVLLECVSNLTANEMYSANGRKQNVAAVVLDGIQKIVKQAANVIIVGNNVFDDGIEYDTSTMEYLKQMAIIQNQTANIADEVIEVVCSIPIIQKGKHNI